MIRARVSRALVGGLVAGLLAVLAACTGTEGTGEKGYISGSGQIRLIDAADRGEPVELTGPALDGAPIDVTDLRGKPVVLNLWWSECAPCRREAPDLVAAHTELGERAAFVGINIRDNSPAMATAFEKQFGVDYPSIYDPDGTANLALASYVRPGAIPSTVVLDAQGRVAAVVSGAVPSMRTLVDLVDEVS